MFSMKTGKNTLRRTANSASKRTQRLWTDACDHSTTTHYAAET
jgi:hypothetical protein